MLRYSMVCLVAMISALLGFTWREGLPVSSLSNTAQSQSIGLQYRHTYRPYYASWGSWHDPQQLHEDRSGATSQDWNVLHHMGGNGPWIEKVEDIVPGGIAVPKGCEIDQIHMMARHAERYPTRRVAMSKFYSGILHPIQAYTP